MDTKSRLISRRTLVRSMVAAAALRADTGILRARPALAKDLVIGFVYVGPKDDFGFNQSHAEGAASVKKLAGLKVVEVDRVAETAAAQQAMDTLISLEGASLLFPTSFGYYNPHVLKLASKFPKVQFRHCGGLWEKAKDPANAGSYFGYIDECEYLAGIVAAYTSKSGKLGFVAAKPIPQVMRNINAFMLGARSVAPTISLLVRFTGDWSLPVKEAEAVNTLIDQGADVITCHVDSPKTVVATAERRGAFTCGFHTNQQSLAPRGYLTGSEWNWSKVYTDFVTLFLAGKPLPNFVRGGLKDGFVKNSPFGAVVGEAARNRADDIKTQMMAGSFKIFKGPIADNKGKIVIPAGTAQELTDLRLEKMDWLAEGVIANI